MRIELLSSRAHIVLAIALTTGVGLSACRVDLDDVRRWETTERGPEKLVAVVAHDKFDLSLRVDAAIALVRMKPRGGRRVGIPIMVDAIAQLPDPEMRRLIIDGMMPTLETEMGKPVGVGAVDGSVAFKDAAFALLIRDDEQQGKLVADDGHRQRIIDALSQWVVVDFEQRFENGSQMYGVEQVVKHIGVQSAKLLPGLIRDDQRKIQDIARMVAASGDVATKEEAAKRMVGVVKRVASSEWVDSMKSTVDEANKTARLSPTESQFAAQLVAFQDDQLRRLFGSMRQVGGRPIVDYCLGYAADSGNSEDRRVWAMAAVEGNLDRENADDVKRVLDLAGSDGTPDAVRDLAFRRVGEMGRDAVIDKLYELFKTKRWQVRCEAARIAIQMSDTSHIPEILGKLPRGATPVFSMTEALSYGGWMGDPSRMPVKGDTGRQQLERFFADPNSAVRTSALGWFYGHGTKQDVEFLEGLYGDNGRLPRCDAGQIECDWTCYVDSVGGGSEEKVAKEAGTVGEFVRYCIVPALKDRDEDPSVKKDPAAVDKVSDQ
ncbi:MAG: hypothetical protein FWD57_05820 [Polyangiaceae bacterium]|nr:hypothetical protein [Polyangiaceae bacterium]